MKLTKQQQIDIVQLCQNAYVGNTGATQSVDGVTDITQFDIYNVEGYVCLYNGVRTVIFAGSNEDVDWVNNTDCKLVRNIIGSKLSEGKVHRGFLLAALTVKHRVLKLLEQLRSKDNNIIIAGHSFGGGITGCIVEELLAEIDNKPDVTLVLVGSPRFCDSDYVNYLVTVVNDIYRIWYGEDPVEKIPLLTMGYVHVRGDNVHEEHYNPTWFFWLWFAPIAAIFSRYDHHPLRLLAAMRGERIPTDKELEKKTRKT